MNVACQLKANFPHPRDITCNLYLGVKYCSCGGPPNNITIFNKGFYIMVNHFSNTTHAHLKIECLFIDDNHKLVRH